MTIPLLKTIYKFKNTAQDLPRYNISSVNGSEFERLIDSTVIGAIVMSDFSGVEREIFRLHPGVSSIISSAVPHFATPSRISQFTRTEDPRTDLQNKYPCT